MTQSQSSDLLHAIDTDSGDRRESIDYEDLAVLLDVPAACLRKDTSEAYAA